MMRARKAKQTAMYCRCGSEEIFARGVCSACYRLQQIDRHQFGGLRSEVFERDGHACRGCGTPSLGKGSLVVHRRERGKFVLRSMVSLCPACHTRVHKTQVVLDRMPPLLLQLWRELHPHGHEQTFLDFETSLPPAVAVSLFDLAQTA